MSDAQQHRMTKIEDLDEVRFQAPDDLVPVIAQDALSGRVLMLAYANREALQRTLETRWLHFWSRARKALWKKGATSGNVLEVQALWLDCDGDTVLAQVTPAGPVCHTGEGTCFGDTSPAGLLDQLWGRLEDRQSAPPGESYTAALLQDENLRLKKLGEETTELVVALARRAGPEIDQEAADLLYHTMVALLASGRSFEDVLRVLAGRAR